MNEEEKTAQVTPVDSEPEIREVFGPPPPGSGIEHLLEDVPKGEEQSAQKKKGKKKRRRKGGKGSITLTKKGKIVVAAAAVVLVIALSAAVTTLILRNLWNSGAADQRKDSPPAPTETAEPTPSPSEEPTPEPTPSPTPAPTPQGQETTQAEAVSYLESLSPQVLGLEGESMDEYELYSGGKVVMVEDIPCVEVTIYSAQNDTGTNDIQGRYLLSRSYPRRLFLVDDATRTAMELSLEGVVIVEPAPAPEESAEVSEIPAEGTENTNE